MFDHGYQRVLMGLIHMAHNISRKGRNRVWCCAQELLWCHLKTASSLSGTKHTVARVSVAVLAAVHLQQAYAVIQWLLAEKLPA